MSLGFVHTPIRRAPAATGLEAARDAQEAFGPRRAPAAAFIALGKAQRRLEALLAGDALAVTTGQQPGLFTGPLFAVQKALTAAALADRLSEAWGRQVTPVFWVAGDDHDFAEVAACTVMGQDGSPERIVLRQREAGAALLPAFREPLGGDVVAALERLESVLPASEFRAGVVARLREAYRPERSVAEAFAAAMADLLADAGVVVLRGWDVGVKRTTGAVLLEALERAAELDDALAGDGARLRAAGLETPVPVGERLALVLVEGASGRDRLRLVEAGGFEGRRGGDRYDLAALSDLLARDPERLSANVLLRPVVEAALLPTVAYVGGPGELAYLPQAGPLFSALRVPRPVPVARLSGMLLDARTEKLLARLGLAPTDVGGPEQELAGRVLRDALPASAVAALAEARRAVGEAFAGLGREAAAVDPTLAGTVESARNQALSATSGIERRLVSALKRSNDTVLQQLARARAALWPGGAPQERVYALASFSSRFGPAALAVLDAAAHEHASGLLVGTGREA